MVSRIRGRCFATVLRRPYDFGTDAIDSFID
jgi:hypothetical protein